MKKKTIKITFDMLFRLEKGRVQLFNKQFYRLDKGKAIRQVATYEQGILKFIDFGKEQSLSKIFEQIKVVFHPKGSVVATRLKQREPLVAMKDSVWVKQSRFVPKGNLKELVRIAEAKKKQDIEAFRSYERQERQAYVSWLRNIKSYCYDAYGKQKV